MSRFEFRISFETYPCSTKWGPSGVCSKRKSDGLVPSTQARHTARWVRQINAYANWLHDFVTNPWALFDTIVVTLSVLSLGPFQTVIPVSALRFFRVIRFLLVLKILGKASSLKRIVAALGNAIFPMLNAFMIVIMVLSMCESSAHSQTRRRPGRHKRHHIGLPVAVRLREPAEAQSTAHPCRAAAREAFKKVPGKYRVEKARHTRNRYLRNCAPPSVVGVRASAVTLPICTKHK